MKEPVAKPDAPKADSSDLLVVLGAAADVVAIGLLAGLAWAILWAGLVLMAFGIIRARA